MSSLLKGREILLIDDAPDMLLLGRKILENNGARVHTAATIEAAKLILTKIIPHIIISDSGLRHPPRTIGPKTQEIPWDWIQSLMLPE